MKQITLNAHIDHLVSRLGLLKSGSALLAVDKFDSIQRDIIALSQEIHVSLQQVGAAYERPRQERRGWVDRTIGRRKTDIEKADGASGKEDTRRLHLG